MTTLARQSLSLRLDGPTFECLVGPTRKRVESRMRAGLTPPPPVSVRAVIDTGASDSVLRALILERLDLDLVGIATARTPSSPDVQFHEQYEVDFHLPSGDVIRSVRVLAAPFDGQTTDCLLGRDVLSSAVVVYIGELDTFSLSL